MKKMNSLGNRILALLLCLVMVLGMFPANAVANGSSDSYATVDGLTEGVTVGGTLEQVQTTFAGTLSWVAKDTDIGRYQDGWWVGLRVDAPATLNMERAKYTGGGDPKPYAENCDGDGSYIQLWGLVTEEYLRSANQTDGLSTYTWKFDWDGNDTFEQTVILDIDADCTVLRDLNGKTVFPAPETGKGKVSGITVGGEVSENGNKSTVAYSNIQLNWEPKNPAAGRGQDGWWVGIQVTAPAQMTKEVDFSNVTYQRLDGEAWSEPRSFWNAQDSNKNTADTERFLTMWGMISPELIAADQDGILTYSWRFDWNRDGLYEQVVVLELNAETIKLFKDGIQQFPYRYGKAESLSGGNVSGSETANSIITAEDLTLNWEPKNPAAGRGQDGWWVGAKITAPADMTKEADFANVTYQRYDNGVWTEPKSFWNAQDSDKNTADAERYLTMWGLVTPELIEADQDGILTYQWRFDWNQDGQYEQSLSLKINSDKLVLLNKESVQVYPKLGKVVALTNGDMTDNESGKVVVTIRDQELTWSPADANAGRVQDGWWTGIKVIAPEGTDISKVRYRRKTGNGYTDPMEYKPDDETQNALQLWGLVTAEYLEQFSTQGRTMNYNWEFDWDGDGAYEQSVTMTIEPEGITLKQAGFDFVQDTDEITYKENYEYTILKPVGGQSTQEPKYSVSDQNVAEVKADKLIIKKAGEVTITATLSGKYYDDITASYTLNIKKADQPDVAFSNPPTQVTWCEEPMNALKVINGLSGKKVVWSKKGDSDVATVDASGEITLNKAGTFTVQAQVPGNDCYNDSAVIEWTIEVVHANQTGFGFVDKDGTAIAEDTITFNDIDKNAEKDDAQKNKYTLLTKGGKTKKGVVYQLVSGDAVSLAEDTNVLTVLKSGEVTIKATKAGDDRYKEATAEINLTVNKDEQKISFEKGKAPEVLYGTLEHENPVSFVGEYSETSKLSFSIEENKLGAEINPETGKITFTDSVDKVGTVTVTATKAGDDCYEATSGTYELKISYLKFEGEMTKPVGDKLNEDCNWFTGNVRIPAPEGYTISADNDLSSDWGDHVVFDVKGADLTAEVYLKDKDGFITNSISVEHINIDGVDPDNLSISCADPAISVMLEEMTFGIIHSNKLMVTVTAEDQDSGIDKLLVSVGDEEVIIDGNGATRVSGSFEINKELRERLVLTAVDVAGRTTELKDNRVLVLDTTHPEYDVAYEYLSGNSDEVNGIIYTQGDVVITVIIDEANFDLNGLEILGQNGKKTGVPQVFVKSVEQSVEWVQNDQGLWEGKIPLMGDGDYPVLVTYTDPAGEVMPTYSKQININSKRPQVDITFDPNELVNGEYSSTDRKATITVNEHNFRAEDVTLTVAVTNANGPVVLEQDYTEYARNAKKWSHEGDLHTLELPVFDCEGRYVVTVDFTSMSGVPAVQQVREFVIDKTAPTNVVISYEQPIIQKIIDMVSFGFFKAETVVTVTATETAAPVDYFNLSYTGDEASAANDIESFKNVPLEAIKSEENATAYTATYTLKGEASGAFTAVAVNKAGLTSQYATSAYDKIVVDTVAPEVYIEYTHDDQTTRTYRSSQTGPKVDSADLADRIFYNGDVTATITVKEANFFEGKPSGENNDEIINRIQLTVTRTDDNGQKTVTEYLCADAEQKVDGAIRQDIEWQSEGDTHRVQLKLEEEGDYVVNMSYLDFSENEAEFEDDDCVKSAKDYTSKVITVDKTAPVIEITYEDQEPRNGNYYNPNRVAFIKVQEHNFRAEEFLLDCDVLKNPEAVADFEAYARDAANWTDDGNVHTLTVDFNQDGIYVYSVDYTDMAGNNDGTRADESVFVVDSTKPTDISISYSDSLFHKVIETLSFGFYNAPMNVTVKANDFTSGVDYFELSYTRDENATDYHLESFEKRFLKATEKEDGSFEAVFELPLEARGFFSVVAVDRAGNHAEFTDKQNVIVTDLNKPAIQVSFEAEQKETKAYYVDANVQDVETFAKAANAFFNGNVIATITVKDENFFEGKTAGAKNDEIIHKIQLTVTRTDDNGDKTVTEYLCAGAEQKVTDALRKEITWDSDGDTHTLQIEFAEDGDYVVDMSYVDFSANEAEITGNDGNEGVITYTSKVITVDKTAPVIEITYENNDVLNENCYQANRTATIKVTEHNFRCRDFRITDLNVVNILGGSVAVEDYQAVAEDSANWTTQGNVHTLELDFVEDGIYTYNVDYTDLAGNNDGDHANEVFVVDKAEPTDVSISYSKNVARQIIEGLTFGFYKAPMTVTVSANDITSGVDYFKLSYTRDAKATDYHLESFQDQILKAAPGENKNAFKATYELPLEARGFFSVVAVDRAGNEARYEEPQTVIVTDLNEPEIQVDFASKSADTKVHFVDANVQDVDTFAEAANAFFNGNVIATIIVNDENFFEGRTAGEKNDEIIHKIQLTVTRTDDNENKTVTEYLCAGAEQKVANAARKDIIWNSEGDTHTLRIEFAEDGDYVVNMSYVDFSENEAVISSNDGLQSRKEYTSKVITVDKTAPVVKVEYGNTEVMNTIDGRDYFNDVQSAVITVTEHNFRASDVAAAILAKNYLKGNVAVTDFAAYLANGKNWTRNGNVYTAKVNYTVDANYTFDIDMVDLALNASADYQPDLFTVDTTAPTNLTVSYSTSILDRSKESYYNAPVTVTISAKDATSGVNRFVYSYSNASGVSRVNAELLNQAIQAAQIRYEDGKAVATFRIPRSALTSDNQFNGTVSFTAYDRSENNTKLVDDTRIIVDNIGPTSTITYNAPVSEYNGTSYYNGTINGTIVINEANFDAADPVVTVTKNGVNYPVKVNWTNNSVDRHTGTFSLAEDGDYYVSVSYKDKSGNQMKDYKSSKLTVDTVKPTINVSNIKANSANKDEQYGFVIEISDINLDPSSVNPVLKTVRKNDQGKYETVAIELGEATTVIANRTYTYTVENLPDDGLYTLTCEASDRASNKLTQILLEDGKSYDEVQFSINREGSTFGFGNEFTEKLVDRYYVYSVNEDVVLVETNVDPIETYSVQLNGQELKEGEDYTTTQTSNSGEWSKRTYVINKDQFQEENEYNIIVTSTDKANTTSYSDVKKLTVAFVVDQTKPVITITGLESGGRYQTNEQTVTLMPTDEGGRLNSLKVLALASDGTPLMVDGKDVSVRFHMEGNELRQHLLDNDGKVTFTVPTGLNSKIRIICNDCAVNEENVTNEYAEEFDKVTVSENRFVIFFANTPAFAATVAGVLIALALVIILILRSKKKGKK